MVYILNKFDPSFVLSGVKDKFVDFSLYTTTEERVKTIIKNERCRSIFAKKEVVNLFKFDQKVQIVKVESIVIQQHDKIIIWDENNFYIIRVNEIQ